MLTRKSSKSIVEQVFVLFVFFILLLLFDLDVRGSCGLTCDSYRASEVDIFNALIQLQFLDGDLLGLPLHRLGDSHELVGLA